MDQKIKLSDTVTAKVLDGGRILIQVVPKDLDLNLFNISSLQHKEVKGHLYTGATTNFKTVRIYEFQLEGIND
jgi:hypothetical protein